MPDHTVLASSPVFDGLDNTPEAVLVALPFTSIRWPSIALGYLSAFASQQGFNVAVEDLNTDLFEKLQQQLPNIISLRVWDSRSPDHMGQLAMSRLVFGASPDVTERYTDEQIAIADSIAEIVKHTVAAWISAPKLRRLRVVGLSVSNTQLLGAIYLARSIKQVNPEVHIVIGGFICTEEGATKLLRSVPSFDSAAIGEGEETFDELLDAVLSGRSVHNIPSLISRDIGGGLQVGVKRPNLTGPQLDELPYPDFSWLPSSVIERYGVELPLLSTRGCYWGKCTFCSDPVHWPETASREPKGVVDELIFQSSAYGWHKFYFCDLALNSTPDRFTTICKELIRQRLGLQMTLLMRPERYINREMLELAKDAGFRCIQFGMEAFSTSLLKRMRKGTTALDNLRLLKLGREVGIRITSNIITHYPGETIEEISQSYDLIKNHRSFFTRNSIADLYRFRARPHSPFLNAKGAQHSKLQVIDTALSSRFFPDAQADDYPPLEYIVEEEREDSEAQNALWEKVHSITKADDDPSKVPYYYRIGDGRIIVQRFNYETQCWETLRLSAKLGQLLELLHDLTRVWELKERLGWPRAVLERALDSLVKQKLVVQDGRSFLAMVIPHASQSVRVSDSGSPDALPQYKQAPSVAKPVELIQIQRPQRSGAAFD